uniref:Putative cytochrome n=1 Tax=Corethrella appendiculata TaxID=1370023 RepID=U5EZ18_9DIPT
MSEILTFLGGIILFLIFAPWLQWFVKRQQYSSILNRIPGPKQYPFIGTMWEFFNVPTHDFFYVITNRSKKYPEICRIWNGMRGDVRVLKPEYIEQVLNSTKHSEKSFSYRFLHPWLGQGLLTSYGERWHKHRKIITPTFHFNILDTFCSVFSEHSDVLVKCLKKFANTNEAFDVYPFITRAALDIVCETAMGVKLNCQNDDKENVYVNAVYAASRLFNERLLRPWLHFDFTFRHSKLGHEYENVLKILHGFTKKVIEERKLTRKMKNSKGNENSTMENEFGVRRKLAFLDLLLEGNEKNNQLTDTDIREEVDTFMFEGHDTTTSGMAWSLLYIGLNENIQENIVEELDSIFQKSDRATIMQDLNEMKYLERVIKETLRLHPSVSFFGRTLSEDVHFGQYLVPKGTHIGIDCYSLHRNTEYYPDPEKFDPDRFLPENCENRHAFAYIPFSAGPRNCIGQKFAILEEKCILSSILRKYKIKAVQKLEDVHVQNDLIGRPREGIHLILEDRK